jgi:uncharacterized delta-60 repeat protein
MQRSVSLILSFAFTVCGIFAQQVALDPSFNPGGSGANSSISRMVLMPNGQIVIVGSFTSFNGTARAYAARLNSSGDADPGFVPSPGTIPNWYGGYFLPSALAVQSDGKVIIGNEDNVSDGPDPVCMVYRYNTDGSPDPAFTPGTRTGYHYSVWALRQEPSTGKILLGGNMYGYNGAGIDHIFRLSSSGVPEWNFAPNFHVYTRCIATQPDGKILAGGIGTGSIGVERLTSSGTIDATFSSGAMNSNAWVYALEPLPDGRIVVTGNFTTYAGSTRNGIARLNADGTLDTSFDPGSGANGEVQALAVQADGKILIGGSFTSYNGTPRNRLARLNADGSLDTSFDPIGGANGTVTAIAVRPDGQVLIAGSFTSYNGAAANRIALLSLPAPIPPVSLQLKALLEGPYVSGGLMNDALRSQPSFPLTEPFTAMGYSHPTYTAGQAIAASTLTTTGNNAIVDWVIVEMRTAASPGAVVASKAALLQKDGDVVGLDGSSALLFQGLGTSNYCPVLRTRNHLPVMLSPSTPVSASTAMIVDFTSASTQVWDNDARTTILGALVLAAGDISFNGTVQYTGSGNDRDPILVRVGSTTPNNTLSGYWREDLNMDGTVKYTGSFNDRDRILVNVGPTTPNNTRVATLP